jgi:hypothetical protein
MLAGESLGVLHVDLSSATFHAFDESLNSVGVEPIFDGLLEDVRIEAGPGGWLIVATHESRLRIWSVSSDLSEILEFECEVGDRARVTDLESSDGGWLILGRAELSGMELDWVSRWSPDGGFGATRSVSLLEGTDAAELVLLHGADEDEDGRLSVVGSVYFPGEQPRGYLWTDRGLD